MQFPVDKTFILYHRSARSLERMSLCVQSCDTYGIDYIRFLGYSPYDTLETSLNRVMLEKHVKFPLNKYSLGEFEATIGHFKLWELIALMDKNKCYVILEDDVIVKSDFSTVKARNDQITFLGPRVEDPLQYSYPEDVESIDYNQCEKFSGAHAYAITPYTAKRLIEQVSIKGLYNTVDGILGLRNELKLDMIYIDPPPVVCWLRRTNSYSDNAPEYINSVDYKYIVP